MDNALPRTLPRFTIVALTLAATFLALQGVRELADIVAPLLLTVNLFIAAYPIQTALVRRGLPRPVGQVILALVAFAILGLVFYALAWAVAALVRTLPTYQDHLATLYDQVVAILAGFGITESQLLTQLKQFDLTSLSGMLKSAFGGVTNTATTIVVVVTMICMLAIDSSSFDARQGRLTQHTPTLWRALEDFIAGVRRYWVVTTIFGLIVAALDWAALAAIGVPLALVWGILSFVTNYIPNVGFIIGVIPPALMALLAQGPVSALLVVAAYSVLNFVIQSVIQPKFNGEAVGVTAMVSFLSLLLWSAVLGPLGALLGLPMTLLVKSLLVDHDPAMRWINAFISSNPETADPSRADDLINGPHPKHT